MARPDWLKRYYRSPERTFRKALYYRVYKRQCEACGTWKRVALHHMEYRGPWGDLRSTREDPFATTTAPTTKQVHAIFWRYIGQAHRKGNLPGRITLDDEWYMGPGGKELVAFGRKPADHDHSAFQGIHALSPLILVDEVCGVPKSIFDAVDALATNSNARVLAIGNRMTRRHTPRKSVSRVRAGM